MSALYIRWSLVLAAAAGLTALTWTHYRDTLASIAPGEVRRDAPAGTIRVAGMVQGGTLRGRVDAGDAAFTLLGEQVSLPVRYQGPPPDNLRAFKRLVVIGVWDAPAQVFRARDIGLIPHYGFVAGAYAAGLAPLAVFLFVMSRRVNLLYEDIKAAALYRED